MIDQGKVRQFLDNVSNNAWEDLREIDQAWQRKTGESLGLVEAVSQELCEGAGGGLVRAQRRALYFLGWPEEDLALDTQDYEQIYLAIRAWLEWRQANQEGPVVTVFYPELVISYEAYVIWQELWNVIFEEQKLAMERFLFIPDIWSFLEEIEERSQLNEEKLGQILRGELQEREIIQEIPSLEIQGCFLDSPDFYKITLKEEVIMTEELKQAPEQPEQEQAELAEPVEPVKPEVGLGEMEYKIWQVFWQARGGDNELVISEEVKRQVSQVSSAKDAST